MLYHLFHAMDFSLPGSGVFNYISFRAGMALIALVGDQSCVRQGPHAAVAPHAGRARPCGTSASRANGKQGTPTMGGRIIMAVS